MKDNYDFSTEDSNEEKSNEKYANVVRESLQEYKVNTP